MRMRADRDGNTALMLAAGKRRFSSDRNAIKRGADVKPRTKMARTALRLVKESKESWTTDEYGTKARRDQQVAEAGGRQRIGVTVCRPCALPARLSTKRRS